MINFIWKNKNIIAGFTNRLGGVSQKPFDDFNLSLAVGDNRKMVIKNREILMENLDAKLTDLVWMRQIHSDNIKVIRTGGRVENTDGLITNKPNLVLTVLVADCIPVLFFDTKNKVVAIAHSGREGGYKNIVGKIIVKMQQKFNSCPENILVALGPSIQGSCYRVNVGIIDKFKNKWHGKVDVKKLIPKNNYLNLPYLVTQQLLRAGILNDNIAVSKICTHCNRNYFSYRRQHKTGRFGGFVVLS